MLNHTAIFDELESLKISNNQAKEITPSFWYSLEKLFYDFSKTDLFRDSHRVPLTNITFLEEFKSISFKKNDITFLDLKWFYVKKKNKWKLRFALWSAQKSGYIRVIE